MMTEVAEDKQPADETTEVFSSGAKRSSRMPRYDLIPKIVLDRLADRFTGQYRSYGASGGALKYGEGNWQKGLPTSDVINHIVHHLTNWQETFRASLTGCINKDSFDDNEDLMEEVRRTMYIHSRSDDDLAGAMWGLAILMYQEHDKMFHDDQFPIIRLDKPQTVSSDNESIAKILTIMSDKQIEEILKERSRLLRSKGIEPNRRYTDDKGKKDTRGISDTKRSR